MKQTRLSQPLNFLFNSTFLFMEMILGCIGVDSMSIFGKNISVGRELSLESLDCSYMSFWLSLLNSVIYLSSSRDFRLLSKLSDHIEIILSLHSPANIFAFSHFNCQHEKRIYHSNTTDRANIQNLKFFNYSIYQSNSRFTYSFI